MTCIHDCIVPDSRAGTEAGCGSGGERRELLGGGEAAAVHGQGPVET